MNKSINQSVNQSINQSKTIIFQGSKYAFEKQDIGRNKLTDNSFILGCINKRFE